MDRKPLQLTRADLRVIAQMVSNKVYGEVNRLMDKNFLRGEIVTVSGCLSDILIEGDSVITPRLVSLDSYNPVVGDKVVLGNIGSMGINKIILGNIDCSVRHKVGTFTTSAVGNQSITGVGFKPKFLRFTWLPADATNAAQGATGVTDGTNQWATVHNILDDGGAGTSQRETDACILINAPAGTAYIEASFVSFDDDGFTINFSVHLGAMTIGYEAYG